MSTGGGGPSKPHSSNARHPLADVATQLRRKATPALGPLRGYQRTRKAFVHRLSDEIVVHLFTLNTIFDPNDFARYRPSQATRACSQVCRKWRRCALDALHVWAASLDFGDPLLWLRIMVWRTGSLPIDIIAPSPFSHLWELGLKGPISLIKLQASYDMELDERKIDLALSLFTRSRTFILGLGDKWKGKDDFPAMGSSISEMLRKPAPHLYTLSLNLPLPVWSMLSARTLDTFSSLRHLGLCAASSEICVTILWLDILRGLRKLEILELYYQIYGTQETASSSTDLFDVETVPLPNIQFLRLQGNNQTCHMLLQKLQLPSTCTLKVEIHDETDGESFEGIMNVIHENLALLNYAQRQRGFKIEFTAYTLSVSTIAQLPMDQGVLSMNWFTEDNDHYHRTFFKILQIMQTTCLDVTYLHLHIDFYHVALKDQHFVRLFQHFPKIHTLSIVGHKTFIRLLPMIHYGSSSSNARLLPDIHTLELCRFEKDDRRRKFQQFTYKAREDFIIDFLEWRPKIKTLRLRECFDFPKHLFPNHTFEDNLGPPAYTIARGSEQSKYR